jgi:hypothetical protein
MLCIGPSSSIGKVIPFYECGQMDKWRLYFTHDNMKALWGMLMKSWAILGFDGHIVCCKHNTSGKGWNYKFKFLFLGVWCVTEFKHLSMHLHFTYNPYQLWGLGTNGVWILSTHWVWHLNIIDMFWLWLNIFPSGCIAKLELVPLPNCSSERVAYAFFDKVLNRFGAPAEVLPYQGTKFYGEF